MYIYIYSCYTCYTVYIHIIPEMQRSAQAIQVYDRICDFEGVKGSSEIQQKMKLGMSQIPTEMSMVFIHRSLSSVSEALNDKHKHAQRDVNCSFMLFSCHYHYHYSIAPFL